MTLPNGTLTADRLQPYIEETVQSGKRFPSQFNLSNIHGEPIYLDKYRGKPFVIAFLCPHHRNTLSTLTKLVNKYTEQEMNFLPVCFSSGSTADIEDLHEMSKRIGLLCRTISITSNERTVGSRHDGFSTAFLLINREGRLFKMFVGNQKKAVLDRAIKELVSS